MKKDLNYLSLNDLLKWKNAQENHHKQISFIKSSHSSIGGEKPKYFPYYEHFKTNRLLEEKEFVERVQQENAKILKKLKFIIKSPPRLRITEPSSPINVGNAGMRIERENRIKTDNFSFAQRLSNTHSVLCFEQYEKDFKNHLKYSELRRRIKLPKLPEISRTSKPTTKAKSSPNVEAAPLSIKVVEQIDQDSSGNGFFLTSTDPEAL
ncbi:unnamed protein product [Blepharisma stoltei]|uniref:Uncharacterized protein n=1 Tax=Blepharisma stoltei TaxID=1481888 RepID=A0AAU9II70_9CILI|nr:unnamed protein product [Blepharisma stoltei]